MRRRLLIKGSKVVTPGSPLPLFPSSLLSSLPSFPPFLSVPPLPSYPLSFPLFKDTDLVKVTVGSDPEGQPFWSDPYRLIKTVTSQCVENENLTLQERFVNPLGSLPSPFSYYKRTDKKKLSCTTSSKIISFTDNRLLTENQTVLNLR